MNFFSKYILISNRPSEGGYAGWVVTLQNWATHVPQGFIVGAVFSVIGIPIWIACLPFLALSIWSDWTVLKQWRVRPSWHKIDTVHDMVSKTLSPLLYYLF